MRRLPDNWTSPVTVAVTSSRYHDVLAGTIGTLDCKKERGYGVMISGRWSVTGGDHGQTIVESRIVWYPKSELRLV